MGYTNESGLFSIPMDDIPTSFDAEGCKATLERSMNQECGDLSSKIKERFDTSLVLKINSSTDLVFTIASFSFHASSPPKSCQEASGYMRSALGRPDDSYHRSILSESINTEKASISHSHTDYALPVALSPQLISSRSSSPHHWSRSLLSFDEALSPLLSTEVSYAPFLKSPSNQAYFSSLHRYKDHSPPPPPPSYHAPSHPSFPSSPSLPQYYAPPPPPPYYYAPPPPQSPYDVKISSSPPLSDYEDLFPFQYFHHPQSSSLSDVDDEAKLYTDHETSQVKVPRAFHLFHNPLLKELSSPWTSHGSKSTKASTVLHRSSDRSPYSRNSPVLVNAKRIRSASSAHRRHVETSHSRYRRSTYISIQK
ncbi:hypothetical protein KP509_20G034900 [Ceratopteris richardii]|nr:hypothetical protein KP509_20G034900 [Ceratopteris richardii]